MATPAAIAGPRQQAWFRALDRARLTGAKPTYCLGRDCYKVTSPRAGDVYIITPITEGAHISYTCTCQAGQRGAVCWHAALVAALPYECNRRAAHKAARVH
jgi:hypothetical protein